MEFLIFIIFTVSCTHCIIVVVIGRNKALVPKKKGSYYSTYFGHDKLLRYLRYVFSLAGAGS
jgi:hypothetical protein